MPLIELQKLSKCFGDHEFTLGPIDLFIQNGERLVLMGANGSGKSTILRLIAGFESPSNGSVAIDRCNISNIPIHKRGIGYTTQRPTLYPHLNIYHNLCISLNLSQKSLRRKEKIPADDVEKRVQQIANMLRVDRFLSRYPSELSGGELCRVSLGRVLVRRPSIMLLDEPLSQVDTKLRYELLAEVSIVLSEFSPTVIYVTHDATEMKMFSERIVQLSNGQLQTQV
jgi:ABC-type sugar transport system ATPase subunit